MIVVIADDLTGAAEIGGMAWRHGLVAEIQVEIDLSSPVDLIVVDTDSRSLSPAVAAERVMKVAEVCGQAGVTHIFKKVDSVLRGPILAELHGLMTILGRERSMLVPANPNLGRTIGRGIYRVHGQPLDQTDFAKDPDHPATSADVRRLLWQRSAVSPDDDSVQLLEPGQMPTTPGVKIGEAQSEEEVRGWAKVLGDDVLPAGASAFFGAYLTHLGYPVTERQPAEYFSKSTLYVNGSAAAASRMFTAQCEKSGVLVLRLPSQIFDTSPHELVHHLQVWADAVVQKLADHPKVMLTLAGPISREAGLSQRLTSYLSIVVRHILARHPVDHLLVEGGATAAAVIQQMDWPRLSVIQEVAVGVVSVRPLDSSMAPAPQRITMKPGSYTWPPSLRC